IHLYMLEMAREHNFTFDAVQMPLNVMDAHYRSFEKLVVPELVTSGIGVLGMKPLANGAVLKSGAAKPAACLRYAFNLPTSVVIRGCDSLSVLEQALEVLRTFTQMSDAEVEQLLAKSKVPASEGEYEPFKTSSVYDSTAAHPMWLGEEPEH